MQYQNSSSSSSNSSRSREGNCCALRLSFRCRWSLVFCVVLLGVHVSSVTSSYNATFQWSSSEWSDCVYRETSADCCQCRRLRTVGCVLRDDGVAVAPFYCQKLEALPPPTEEACAPCQQNCALSTWEAWTACSDTCSPSSRTRVRRMLLLPSSGKMASCAPQVDLEDCEELPACALVDPSPRYTWWKGGWTGCRQVDNSTESCSVGQRTRLVECLQHEVDRVANEFCLFFLRERKPSAVERCSLPCDCVMSEWGQWGACSRSCRGGPAEPLGYQVRTRTLVTQPINGGLVCPSMSDTRPCDVNTLPSCPRFTWYKTDWLECTMVRDDASQGMCGSGVQRREVICVSEDDDSHTAVDGSLCVQDSLLWRNVSIVLKPQRQRACEVPCATDCELGEWENWSACTQSCGRGGARTRRRPVLVEETRGGQECNKTHRFQQTGCEEVPCSWWHTGQWSKCLPSDFSVDTCGPGMRVTTVYCLSSLDEVLADDNCTQHGSKPANEKPCTLPCDEECDVSNWSEWSPCSASCGPRGGMQTRVRTALAGDGSGDYSGDPCLPEDELSQSRTCNQHPCQTHLWQVTPWSECRRRETNDTEMCGKATGIQTRPVHCELDPGYPMNESLCGSQPKPSMERSCASPCPLDCKMDRWSDWTACSATCGPDSVKMKFRQVVKLALHGGVECPKANDEGVISKSRRCRKPMCNEVQWSTQPWGDCVTPRNAPGCGWGLHTRNVTCVGTDLKTTKDGTCYEAGLGSPPPSQKVCYVPCSGDCDLLPWSPYGTCSQSCGDQPGTRSRTRQLANPDAMLSLTMQCPDLKEAELTQTQPCGHAPCPAFHWDPSPWASCVPHQQQTGSTEADLSYCGRGTQRRHVLCRRMDGADASDHLCDQASPAPERHRSCDVACPIDCEVTPWSEWSVCSQPCGTGYTWRNRTVVAKADLGGRPCLHLMETSTCELRDCQQLDWAVTEWSECKPYWGMPCARGHRYRAVQCPAGSEFNAQCQERAPKPSTTLDCYVPCLGDCRLSPWSTWSICDCTKDNATRGRQREVLQEPLPSAAQCGELTETEACDCPQYQLIIDSWGSCQVKNSCGPGTRHRALNCIRSNSNILVSLHYCHLGNLSVTEACEMPCAVDCQLTPFTHWSPCVETCGSNATKTRRQAVHQEANALGRPCPDGELLTQTTVCPTVPCHLYAWHRGLWGPCSLQASRCGTGTRSRDVWCQRSDGIVVEQTMCLQQDNRTASSMTLLELSGSQRQSFDLDLDRSCGESCPADCVMSEWGDYGPCFTNCSAPEHEGVQVRSRVMLRPARSGQPCPDDTIQTRPCSSLESVCPVFVWHAEKWNPRGKRKIHCTMQDGSTVTGGCVSALRPARHLACQPACADYAECIEGACVCQPGFVAATGDQHCLPKFGCVTSSHCVINNTYCDRLNKECLCWDQTLPNADLNCPPRGLTDSSVEAGLTGLSALFLYILIGCLILLLLVALLCVACLVKRRGRRSKKMAKCLPAATMTETVPMNYQPPGGRTVSPTGVPTDSPLTYKTATTATDKNYSQFSSTAGSPYSTYQSNVTSSYVSGPEAGRVNLTPSPPWYPRSNPNGKATNIGHTNQVTSPDIGTAHAPASTPNLPRAQSPLSHDTGHRPVLPSIDRTWVHGAPSGESSVSLRGPSSERTSSQREPSSGKSSPPKDTSSERSLKELGIDLDEDLFKEVQDEPSPQIPLIPGRTHADEVDYIPMYTAVQTRRQGRPSYSPVDSLGPHSDQTIAKVPSDHEILVPVLRDPGYRVSESPDTAPGSQDETQPLLPASAGNSPRALPVNAQGTKRQVSPRPLESRQGSTPSPMPAAPGGDSSIWLPQNNLNRPPSNNRPSPFPTTPPVTLPRRGRDPPLLTRNVSNTPPQTYENLAEGPHDGPSPLYDADTRATALPQMPQNPHGNVTMPNRPLGKRVTVAPAPTSPEPRPVFGVSSPSGSKSGAASETDPEEVTHDLTELDRLLADLKGLADS